MSDGLTSLASENLNPGLRALLEDVRRGHIRVPRFQRPFIWTDGQRLELLRSIRDTMPIGSLLIWRTSRFKLATFPEVGPHVIPPIVDAAPTTGWQYILDGHQRVSSLLGLLLQAERKREGEDDEIDWDIQYDLREREFVFAKRQSIRSVKRPLLPLWTLLDGRLVNKQMRAIRNQKLDEWSEAEIAEWELRADQLSYSFQQYRIPIVVMVTDSLELAIVTFQRINSQGTAMSEEHFVAALTWSEQFDLREQLDQLREALPVQWQGLDEKIFLQVCKGLAGLDMSKAGQAELANKLKQDKGAELLERAGTGIQRAISLLDEQACVVSHEWLPYTFQLVLLAVELADWERNARSDFLMLRWFWRTSWSEVFSSASYRQIRDEHDRLKTDKDAEWVYERALPPNLDFRVARTRLFVLRLAMKQRVYDGDGALISGRELLTRHGRNALVRLFPPPRGASDPLKQELQRIGNSGFISPEHKRAMRDRLLSGEMSPEERGAHFVNPDALAALQSGDMPSFLWHRLEEMSKFDAREFEACHGRNY